MRAFVELMFLVSQDSQQMRQLLNLDQVIDDSDATTSSTFQSGQGTLSGGQSSFQIPFGGVTHASKILILAYNNISVQLDDIAAPPVKLLITPAVTTTTVLSTAQTSDQPGIFFLGNGHVDSIYISNLDSQNPATFAYALVGEASS